MIKYSEYVEQMAEDSAMTVVELEQELGRDYLTMTYVTCTEYVPPTFNFSASASSTDYYSTEKLELESRMESSFNSIKTNNTELDYLNTSKNVLYHPGDIITYKTKPCTVKSVTSTGIITFYRDSLIILPPAVVLLNNIKKIKNKHIPLLYSEIKATLQDVPDTVYFATFCDYFDIQEAVIYQYINPEDQESLLEELSQHVDVSKVRKHR